MWLMSLCCCWWWCTFSMLSNVVEGFVMILFLSSVAFVPTDGGGHMFHPDQNSCDKQDKIHALQF